MEPANRVEQSEEVALTVRHGTDATSRANRIVLELQASNQGEFRSGDPNALSPGGE